MDQESQRILSQPFMTVEELRRITRTARNTTYAAIKRGDIEVIKMGRRTLIPTAPWRRKLGLEVAA